MSPVLRIFLAILVVCAGLCSGPGRAQAASPITRDLPPGLQIPAAAQPGPNFDVDKATEAYIDLLSPEQRQLSDEYFEGGYWLQLWELLYGVGVCGVLLLSGLSQRMRDFAQRVSRRLWLSTMIYAALFLAASFVLGLPLSIYSDYFREHQYGLANQDFGGWMGDQLKGLGVTVVLGSVGLMLLYTAARGTGRRWWVWATGLTFVATLFVAMIAPVFIAPLFNDYKPLPEGPVRDAVLSLARANQIPTDHVEWFDASKQTTRISANVSGFLGTTRVSLNDNLLNKTSLPEIKAVLGHEMGHYVLNHVLKGAIYVTLVFGLVFALLHVTFDYALARWGARLKLGDRGDAGALPLAVAIFSIIMFLLTPLTNLVTHSTEAEADAFGLNAAREPQAFAMAAMRLSTYRKIKPGKLEEIIFYDHPSGYARVHASMVWLKENPSAAETPSGPVGDVKP